MQMRFAVVILLAACGGGGKPTTGPGDSSSEGAEVPINVPGQPGIGAHGLAFYRYNVNSPTTISTPAIATQATGSTMVVSVGRGNRYVFALPTDNKGNAPYQ